MEPTSPRPSPRPSSREEAPGQAPGDEVFDGATSFDADVARMPLGRLLPRVGIAVDRHYQRLVGEHGLTPTALGVLAVLGRADGLSHRQLAGRLGLTPATLTPVIDVLEAAGEVRRRRDAADRRVVRLWLTAAGRDRAVAASGRVAARLQDRLPRPPPAHEEAIRGYLLAVLDAVCDDPLLDGRVLDGPVLDGRVLDDPVLDEPVLDDPVLDDPGR